MTDMDARTLSIPLEFLEDRTYEATIWKDAPDSYENPTHLEKDIIEVDRKSVIEAALGPAGGHVVHLKPKI